VTGIDQLVVAASGRDAITTAALNARDLLRRLGSSRLLARHVHPDLLGSIDPLHSLPPAYDDRNPLIVHASIGDDRVQHHALTRPGPVVLQYHNITPPRFFEGLDPAFARHLAEGRHQLIGLRGTAVAAFADSEYNASDLETLGYDDVRVVPLILHPERLREITPDPAAANHLEVVVTGPVILCVAQLLPHKRADLVLQAYNLLVTHHMPEAHLIIVGAQRNTGYSAQMRDFAQDLRMPRCWLAGEVEDEVLAAMYARADVLVVASEHEGFCVPLVEAMAFGMPIVARANAAVPETLGGAGLLVDGDAGPELLAEALLAVLSDATLAADLGRRSAARLSAFDPLTAQASLLRNLSEVL
jgi:glycosyltransferase involved in cell wall biosynthesis